MTITCSHALLKTPSSSRPCPRSAVVQARASQNVARPSLPPAVVSSRHHGNSRVGRHETCGLSSLSSLAWVLEATSSEPVLEPTDRWCVCVCIRARGNPASRSDLPLVLRYASLRCVLSLLLPTSTSRAEHHTPLATACPQEDATAHGQLFQRSPICLREPLGKMLPASPVDTAITQKCYYICSTAYA
jgi:hypothetical protein